MTNDWFVNSILGDLPDDPNPAPLSDPVGEFLAGLQIQPSVPEELIAKHQAERSLAKLRGDIVNLPREATNPFRSGRCEPDLADAFRLQTMHKLGSDIEGASWVPSDPRLNPYREAVIPSEPTPLHDPCFQCGRPKRLCECSGGFVPMPGGGGGTEASKVLAFRSLSPTEPAALLEKRTREPELDPGDFAGCRFDGLFVQSWR
jgi:hypothetical protein